MSAGNKSSSSIPATQSVQGGSEVPRHSVAGVFARLKVPILISKMWDVMDGAIFRPGSKNGIVVVAAAVVGNPNTPVQVLWDMQMRMRASARPDERAEILKMIEDRWKLASADQLPPMLGRKDWTLRADNPPQVTGKFTRIFTETHEPLCLLAGWLFTKEFLIAAQAPNLDALLQAFQDNPASPAEVVAEAMSFQVLN